MDKIFMIEDIKNKFQEELLPLRKNFKYIRAYHGCKIYKENQLDEGLIPLNEEYIIENFLEFKKKLDIQEGLNSNLLKNSLDTTDGKIWFCLGRNELLEYCNHYIIYGSESVHGLLLKYKKQDEVRRFLSKEGKGAYLECNIPIELIPNYYIKSIEEYIKNNEDLSDSAFSIRKKLDKKYIDKIVFPEVLISVLDGKKYINNK